MPRVISQTLVLSLVCSAAVTTLAAEPLHVRIDALIDATKIGPQATQVDDAEFLRRINLHLTGTVPSASEVRKFLEDKSTDKRSKLVERLITGPEYARHMTDVFSVMLMERRSNAADWLAFLKSSIEQNKPWTEIVATIIAADGVDAKNRGPVNFYFARNVEPNLMTREVGRIFFGMDIQCAQCHDHPLIDDYLQADYYGIYAFLNRTYQFQPNKKKPAVLADNPKSDVSFKSVFTGFEGKTRPRLPREQEIDEPTFKKDDEYKVKPDKKKKELRPIPKYSRRLKFAELVKKGTNKAFRRNIANRLWAHMMGRGLVHPVDLHHSDNPPSHPELLDLLADEFAAMNFDIRAFLKQLALTKTYQRSVSLPGNLVASSRTMDSRLAEFEALQKSLANALGSADAEVSKADEQLEAARTAKTPIDEELKKANAALAAAQKAHAPNAKALADSQKQLSGKQAVATPLAEAAVATVAAAKLLPADTELANILKSLDASSKKRSSEAAALAKTVAAHQAKAKTTGDVFTAADKAAKAVQSRHEVAQKNIAEINKRIAGLTESRRLQNVKVTVAERRSTTIKAFVDYGGKLAEANDLQTTADKAIAKAQVLQQAAEKARSTMTQAKQEFDAAQKMNEEATKSLAETKRQLADKPAVAAAASEAASKLAAALTKIPSDGELKDITSQLKAKADNLATEVASLKKALPERDSAVKAAADRLNRAQQAHATSTSAFADTGKKLAPLAAQRNEATAKADKAQAALDEAYKELTGHWSRQFVIRPLEPLTAEQLAWSIMKINGLPAKQRAASAAAINKKTPLKPEEQKDAAKVAAREKQIDDAAYNKLKANVAQFVKLFAASAGQPQHDFVATFDQALFFANAGTVRGWIAPSGGNLADRLIKMDNPKELAEELYLGVLTRRPTDEEAATVTKYLAARPKEKSAAVQEVVWALLTSTEFRFNH